MELNILIVDDQAEIRQLLMATLKGNKRILHEENNGDDAWRVAQYLRPNIIILDVMMPGALDGYQVCERIKADSILKLKTKVILLTARNQSADFERGKAAGCDAFLTKPFSPIELLDAVSKLSPKFAY